MKTAFIIFEDMTMLDFVGAYDALTRLKTMSFVETFEWDICAFTEEVSDGRGLSVRPTQIRPSLSGYDMLVVPGGFGARTLMTDEPFLHWLGTFSFSKGIAASVCTGALLLGSRGILKGRKATTHRSAFDLLKPLRREGVQDKKVNCPRRSISGVLSVDF
jgi:cyclohexyl-isocyanide hydratase